MKELIDKYFHDQNGFHNIFHAPAGEDKINHVEKVLGVSLPDDYKDFLKFTNGFGGFIGESLITFNLYLLGWVKSHVPAGHRFRRQL